MKKTIFLILALFLLSGCTWPTGVANAPIQPTEEPQALVNGLPSTVSSPVVALEPELPGKVDLPVSFATQAPIGNWDLPYQEACEEAALITASKYFKNEPLSNEIMNQEIIKLVEWEKVNLGTYSDTSVQEVARMASEYFKLKVTISEEVTVDNIKKALAKGKLVLIPAAGRLLGNPNFKALGPLYHFVVVRGYNAKEFIVNDVGTRKGDGYKYAYEVLVNATHDLPLDSDGLVWRPYEATGDDAVNAARVQTGGKRMLIISQ